jgi:hypothetical protein
VATAVLSCVILRRKFTPAGKSRVGAAYDKRLANPTLNLFATQWLGVAMLTLASALPGVASFTSSSGRASSGLTPHALLAGTAVMACVALSSGSCPASA